MAANEPIILHGNAYVQVRYIGNGLRDVGQHIIERLAAIEARLEVITDDRLLGGRCELENLLVHVQALAVEADEPSCVFTDGEVEQARRFLEEWAYSPAYDGPAAAHAAVQTIEALGGIQTPLSSLVRGLDNDPSDKPGP